MRKDKNGEWRAFDMMAEGISLLDAKQSELHGILRQQGIEHVITLLDKKSKLQCSLEGMMAMPNLQFNKVAEDTVAVTGELTRDTLVNESLLNQLLENAQSELYFDLCEVSRVDTAGLAWLIHSLGKLKRQRHTP